MTLDAQALTDYYLWLLAAAGVALICLWLAFVFAYGALRGSLAVVCRSLWLAPLFMSFFPETITEELPRTMTLTPLHILIDDSQSMQEKSATSSESPRARAEQMLKQIKVDCARLGCLPKVSLLSEQDDDVKRGYSPLSSVLDGWLYRVGADPWLLISDGGDSRPTERWPQSLHGVGLGLHGQHTPRGLIMGFAPKNQFNVWIKDADVPPFSFADKPLTIGVNLKRSQARREADRVQLQVTAGEAPLATVNAIFAPGALDSHVQTTIPPLPRGQHLLTISALPIAGETALWDNSVQAQVEVLPNTVGVLHLLGSPSWDGRFLRRYLKGEPKYDLISFFILRDPWDSQQVNERELSLIPFPVERLFREELPNFRVVVIQNFTLFQFLLPEYQNNLVKFVQDGGGLLFVGGPRALTPADLGSSPLKAILPFEVDDAPLRGAGTSAGAAMSGIDMLPFGDDFGEKNDNAAVSDRGPAYDPNLEFRVTMARPDPAKRALANVYEDWEGLADALTGWSNAKGLHHMERVKFKTEATTILLNAKPTGKMSGSVRGSSTGGSEGGGEIPLAVASYPGKGRALWFFSDSLWRLAQTPSENAAREVYNKFMQGAMTWLMRQDMRQPLVAKNFLLRGRGTQGSSSSGSAVGTWRVSIQGPAARFYQPSPEWKLTVCGAVISGETLTVTKQGSDEWELTGPLPVRLSGGQRCSLELVGTHAAFGSVQAKVTTIFPETYKDKEIDAAPQKLEELAELTGAALILPPKTPDEAVVAWLGAATGQEGVALPSRFKTLRNYYWILDRPVFWLFLLFLPLEVIVRRWDQLFGVGSGRLMRRRAAVDGTPATAAE